MEGTPARQNKDFVRVERPLHDNGHLLTPEELASAAAAAAAYQRKQGRSGPSEPAQK